METLKILLTIIFVLVCIALSAVIMMQEGKNSGLGALAGGSSETYMDKNKGRTKSGKLLKITKILAVLFLLLSAILNLNFDRTETADTTTDTTAVEATAVPDEATEEPAATEEASEDTATE